MPHERLPLHWDRRWKHVALIETAVKSLDLSRIVCRLCRHHFVFPPADITPTAACLLLHLYCHERPFLCPVQGCSEPQMTDPVAVSNHLLRGLHSSVCKAKYRPRKSHHSGTATLLAVSPQFSAHAVKEWDSLSSKDFTKHRVAAAVPKVHTIGGVTMPD